jgi:CBS domain-containing protein
MSWTVGAVMTREVESVRPETPYKEIVERMLERRISALPVVGAAGQVLGVVSEADLMLKEEKPRHLGGALVQPRGDEARAMARNAAALMTAPAVTVGEDASLTEAARLMHHRRVKRLPVVDEAGSLVGIVSRADVLSAFARSDESIETEVREDVLLRTLAIDPETVTVTVRDGVVRLEGELETRSLVRILERLVLGAEGVIGLDDRLRWALDDTHLHPDSPPDEERFSARELP